MIITGHLASAPVQKRGKNGQIYYELRVAENYGSNERRRTIWFDVVATIKPVEADLLPSGSAVKIDGRLDPEAYISKRALAGAPVPTTWDGVIAALKEAGALKVGLKLITNSKGVEPHQFERRQNEQPEENEAPASGAAPF